MRGWERVLGAALGAVLLATAAMATMPPLPLEEALKQADLIVVGKLGALKPHSDVGTRPVATLTVERVVKGADNLKEVLVSLYPNPPPPGGIHIPEGTEGIFLLKLIPPEYVKDARVAVYTPGRMPYLLKKDELPKVEQALKATDQK